MIKQKLLTIIIWTFSCIAYGQNTTISHLDSLVNNFVKVLQEEKIDTICVYENYSAGELIASLKEEDRCNYPTIFKSAYIFWVRNGKSHISKKDNCFDYSSVEIKSDSLWNCFFNYKNKILKEEVKKFNYIFYNNGKKEVGRIQGEPYNYYFFKVLFGNVIITKSFNSFDLQPNIIYGKLETNINYKHNMNLKSKYFVDRLEKVVSSVEKNKLLKKTRR